MRPAAIISCTREPKKIIRPSCDTCFDVVALKNAGILLATSSSYLPRASSLSTLPQQYGSRSGDLDPNHADLEHHQPLHHLRHHPSPAPPLLHRPEALLRIHRPPQRSHLPSRHPSLRHPAPKVLVRPHHLQPRPHRVPPQRPRILPPRHQRSRRPPLARYQRLALVPKSTQQHDLELRLYSTQRYYNAHLRYRPRRLARLPQRPKVTPPRRALTAHATRSGRHGPGAA